MAGRHPKAMRPRDERAHPVVQDALDRGYLDSGTPYPIDGIPTHDAANEARLAVNRAGRHFNVSTPSWVVDEAGHPCYRDCADPGAPHGVRFRVHSKDAARMHVHQQTGGDPAKLKYNPFQRSSGPRFEDDGRPIAAS